MFNGLAINPAYAGSHGALSANFLYRFQNVGLPGAEYADIFNSFTDKGSANGSWVYGE